MKMAWKIMVLVAVLGASAAQAAPKAALFVQNRAGAQLEGQLDAFNDLVSTRLADAGIEVIRSQDVLRGSRNRAMRNPPRRCARVWRRCRPPSPKGRWTGRRRKPRRCGRRS